MTIIGRIDVLTVRTTRTGAPTKAASMTGVRCAQLTSGTIRLGDQHRPGEHGRHACMPGEVVNAGKQRLEGPLIKHPGPIRRSPGEEIGCWELAVLQNRLLRAATGNPE